MRTRDGDGIGEKEGEPIGVIDLIRQNQNNREIQYSLLVETNPLYTSLPPSPSALYHPSSSNSTYSSYQTNLNPSNSYNSHNNLTLLGRKDRNYAWGSSSFG